MTCRSEENPVVDSISSPVFDFLCPLVLLLSIYKEIVKDAASVRVIHIPIDE